MAQRAGLELCVQLIVTGYSKHTLLYLIRAVERLDVVRFCYVENVNIASCKFALFMFVAREFLFELFKIHSPIFNCSLFTGNGSCVVAFPTGS